MTNQQIEHITKWKKLKAFAWFDVTSRYLSVGALTVMGWLYIILFPLRSKSNGTFNLHFNHIYGHEFG